MLCIERGCVHEGWERNNTVSFGPRMFSDSTEYLIFELIRLMGQLSHFAFRNQTTWDKCTFLWILQQYSSLNDPSQVRF